MQTYLRPGRFIDSDHRAVVEFAERWRGASREPASQAVALYLAVRDEVRYNPYAFSLNAQTLKASHALAAGESYCVPKANLLAACARHCGIPARIGLADVRNHLSTPRLLELLRSEVFAMHGYTELYLDGRWVSHARRRSTRHCAGCSRWRRWSSTACMTASSTLTTTRGSATWNICTITVSSRIYPSNCSSTICAGVIRICSRPVRWN